MSPYLSVKEVAVLLGKSTKWVYGHSSDIPGHFRLAGSLFWDKEVLSSCLKSLAEKPTTSKAGRNDRYGLL